MKSDQIYELKADDVLEILLGKYFYEIMFETNSISEQDTDGPSTAPAVTAVKGSSGVWESVGDGKVLIFTPNNVKASNKVFTKFVFLSSEWSLKKKAFFLKSLQIAGYDLDGTIITTKSEKRFPQDVDDWKLFPYVASKLTNLQQDGYKIVFFTNQNGISLGKYKVEDYKVGTNVFAGNLSFHSIIPFFSFCRQRQRRSLKS